jgi:hypothetical protein
MKNLKEKNRDNKKNGKGDFVQRERERKEREREGNQKRLRLDICGRTATIKFSFLVFPNEHKEFHFLI